jgi:gamma-glutamyltranspeptidase/glutathione hydrolase
MRANRPTLAISVAGGDLQDQETLNVLVNHIDFGMKPAEAVTAPRFSTGQHEDSFNPTANRPSTILDRNCLMISSSVAKSVRDELERRGNIVKATSGPIAQPVMLYVDQNDIVFAAGDPAAKRHAASLQK